MRKLLFLITLLLMTTILGQAQGQVGATSLTHLNMRSGPGVKNEVIAQLQPETALIVEGRNEAGDWAFVSTADGVNRGWVAMGFIRFDQEVRIMHDLPDVTGAAPQANNAASPDTDEDDTGEGEEESRPGYTGDVYTGPDPNKPLPVMVEETREFPTVVLNIANARAIYNRGLSFGRNPAVIMKIGESNIAGTVFLCNLQWGNYIISEEYAYLEEMVAYFNTTGSFCRYNVSAEPGFSTFSLFDPTFSPPEVCEPNEEPLACEIRRSQAMYAFVYVGIGDHLFTTDEGFRVNLVKVVRMLKNNGVIPILATYPMADFFNYEGSAPAFNTVIRQVAAAERVPLIDVRAATFGFENRGTGPDGYHLSVPDDAITAFVDNQNVYGRTLYEFQAMQVLYQLHTTFNQ